MQASIFNLRVPLPARGEVFLMNTLSDAQLVVSSDVADLMDLSASLDESALDQEAREALGLLRENGFLVESREADRDALNKHIWAVKRDTSELHITVLTTLQCNFACDYCFQGDHGDYNKFAQKMSPEMAVRVAEWIERELDHIHPENLVITFFGGEPLLNVPAMYEIAERMWAASQARGVVMKTSIITNGLLLTEEIVDRMVPLGLKGVKVTLDGDREMHNQMRPLRGGQGTFDRIVENVRRVADKVPISIGGNFDEKSSGSFTGLLDFLREQEFADKLVKVNFKPVVRTQTPVSEIKPVKGFLPLTLVSSNDKPLGGTCMTAAGSGGGAGKACDSCNFLDDEMTRLRDDVKRHGFPTPDGVHNGPCHLHMQHAHTIGPDGSLYACPGFTGELAQSTGHVDDRRDPLRDLARQRFDALDPWKDCGDCAFIPVCAGGCLVASHTELGDMNLPTCHKRTYESALVSLAHDAASAA